VSGIRRREFLLLGGGAAAWPLFARVQQAGKLPTIGLLVSSTPADESQRVGAFTQRLHQLGWIDGRTITIELRSADGRPERATRSRLSSSDARLM
jgi:putative tryptophan/tyrosine transport system substrate-binding protein